MKTHMARKDAERNAAWQARQGGNGDASPQAAPVPAAEDTSPATFAAQMKAQLASAARPMPQRVAGRPGPNRAAASAGPEAVQPVELVKDLTNLPAIWEATKQYLAANKAVSVVNMIGETGRIEAFTGTEATLAIPTKFKNYVGEKVRSRVEEAVRAVTGRVARLSVTYYELVEDESIRPPGAAPSAAANRVPPELIEAVRNTPVVRTILEKLGGDIAHIELLEHPDE